MASGTEVTAKPVSKKTIQAFQRVVRKAMIISKLLRSPTTAKSYTKKALVIGIQYLHRRQESGLPGSFNDATAFASLLESKYQYETVLMTDHIQPGAQDPLLRPTRENVLKQIDLLMRGAKEGDHRVFYFAGHCGQKDIEPSEDGTIDDSEEDNKNEFLVCSDQEREKAEILDDELKLRLVEPAKQTRSRLVAILDACHSGTLLDLPHHRCNRVGKGWALFRRGTRKGVELLPDRLISEDGFLMTAFEDWTRFWRAKVRDGRKPRFRCHGFCPRIRKRHQRIFCLSACKDGQEAIDNVVDGSTMTKALIEILSTSCDDSERLTTDSKTCSIPRPTKLRIKDVMKCLQKRFPRETAPQLSTDFPARMNSFFIL